MWRHNSFLFQCWLLYYINNNYLIKDNWNISFLSICIECIKQTQLNLNYNSNKRRTSALCFSTWKKWWPWRSVDQHDILVPWPSPTHFIVRCSEDKKTLYELQYILFLLVKMPLKWNHLGNAVHELHLYPWFQNKSTGCQLALSYCSLMFKSYALPGRAANSALCLLVIFKISF